MDVLSDVLRAVRLTGAIFFDIERHAPWVAETPAGAGNAMPGAGQVIGFHAIIDGCGWAELLDGSTPPLRVGEGDIIVVPMADPHVLCSAPGLRAAPNADLHDGPKDRPLPFLVGPDGDGNGERTRFVCGYLGCDARPLNPILQGLPRLLHARASDGAAWMTQLIRMAVDETAMHRAGGETLLRKVAELMLVYVVRQHVGTLRTDACRWLSGLRDNHIGAALALMHSRPAEPWTLERLAREVGLSRSAFAERFVHVVDDPPMRYLTRWRIQLASRLLEHSRVGVAQVAAEVGYESEAAFNRAFKKCVGTPPGAWRRSRQGRFATEDAAMRHAVPSPPDRVGAERV